MNLSIAKVDTPTPQQNQAINFLCDFVNSKDLLAVLNGYAGTGKTYLLKHFLNNNYKQVCCVTAPTHKAVRVIENVLGKKGKTLQSLLGLRMNTDLENFNISNPSFDPLGNEYIKNYKLIIIDECSQVNESLFNLIKLKSQQYNTKVLFVGDFCQLPPVKELLSKTANINLKFELTEIIRQNTTNPLLILLDLIRNDILHNTNDFLPYLIKNRSNIVNHEGYLLLNDVNFKTALSKYYKHDNFTNNTEFIRTVAWTNKCVGEWNIFIRNLIFDNPKDILHEHDLLTAYNTIVDDFNSAIITNSEDYVVSTIRPYTDSTKIATFAVNLKNIYTKDNALYSGMETATLKIVNPKDKDGFVKFYSYLSALHFRAINSNPTNRQSNWRNYYDFKNKHLSLLTFNLGENNNKALVKKDIDYGYALTVHKSQGSTYENIAIDLNDILYHKASGILSKKEKDKLIYVALSRAKNIALIKL